MERVLIICGSKSDEEIAKKAIDTLDEFGVTYRYEIASAHRNPEKVDALVKGTSADVIIAIAGLSAALPGVVASRTTKPVIGVPVNVKLDGLDALLSMMQMPSGVPVATVGIDNGKNAALLAIEILALKDELLAEKLKNKVRVAR
ncbi:MAG: 5-(carboxyamino)imidazole ribonucleotide mutase [Candidatus Bilamarchaeaceae archaeon]